MGEIGKLRWRVLMIVVLLGALFVPLRTSLLQVRDELVSRDAVKTAIRQLSPRDTILSEQVDAGARVIRVNLMVTKAVPPEKIAAAEKEITRRTGKEARVTVQRIASEDELARLRERLRVAAAPAPLEVDTAARELTSRLGTALAEFWPAGIELEHYELAFGREGAVVRLRYRSPAPLDEPAKEMTTKFLRSRLDAPDLKIEFEQLGR